MNHARRLLGAVLAIAVLPSAGVTQTADDWDLVDNPRQKSLLAVTAFDNGLTILAGCIDGRYEAAIAGLPPAASRMRDLQIQFRDSRVTEQSWFVARRDSAALAPLPAPFARELRRGGQQITVPRGAPDGRRDLRYVVDLPRSTSAIDQTLTRCGRPLTDPRDLELLHLPRAGMPAELEWEAQPQVNFPVGRYAYGWAVVSCLIQPNGGLRECEVETEQPAHSGFARAAMRSLEQARLRDSLNPGAPVNPARVYARFNFVVEGFEEGAERPPPTGSRIPPRRR